MIQKVDHIGILVKNTRAALAPLQAGLRLKIEKEEISEERGVRITYLPVGEVYLELIEPLGETTVISKRLLEKGEGIDHICFQVSNLDELLQYLPTQGVTLQDKKPRTNLHGREIAFIDPHSTCGVLIELAEGNT